LCIYGLNCPWLKDPAGLIRHGLVGLSTLYVQEIRRRKASGPYNLGGWSAGGICAYEAALQLAQAGETVKSLILLDSPNPIGLERLPRRFYDFLNAAGVFGDAHSGRRAPSWLLDHFLAFIDALDAYKPVAWHKLFPPHIPMPRASILWAADGVAKHRKDACIELREDDPREMRWLVQDRTNFGPNGWDVLLPEEGYVTTERIEGADHFSMLGQGANAQVVADFLGRALGV
jgi:naphtho-gamma-pyrone polyketide synthase